MGHTGEVVSVKWQSDSLLDVQAILDTTVADLLTRWPEAARVFWRYRMMCVGFPLARFERVREAARAYGMTEEQFGIELWQAITYRTW